MLILPPCIRIAVLVAVLAFPAVAGDSRSAGLGLDSFSDPGATVTPVLTMDRFDATAGKIMGVSFGLRRIGVYAGKAVTLAGDVGSSRQESMPDTSLHLWTGVKAGLDWADGGVPVEWLVGLRTVRNAPNVYWDFVVSVEKSDLFSGASASRFHLILVAHAWALGSL